MIQKLETSIAHQRQFLGKVLTKDQFSSLDKEIANNIVRLKTKLRNTKERKLRSLRNRDRRDIDSVSDGEQSEPETRSDAEETEVHSQGEVREVQIKGVGNCFYRCLAYKIFYRCLAYKIFGNQDLHMDIRKNVVQEISQNKKFYEEYIDGNIGAHIETLEKWTVV